MVNIALWGLKQIYKPNYNYAKAGVMLSELVPAQAVQTDLFSQATTASKSKALMTAIDSIWVLWSIVTSQNGLS